MLDLFRGMTTRRSYYHARKKHGGGGGGGGGGVASAYEQTPYEQSRRYKNHRFSEVEVPPTDWRRGSYWSQQQQQQQQQPSPPPPPPLDGGVSYPGGTLVSNGHFQEYRSVNPSPPSVTSSQGTGSPMSPAGELSGGGKEDSLTARLLERCERHATIRGTLTARFFADFFFSMTVLLIPYI